MLRQFITRSTKTNELVDTMGDIHLRENEMLGSYNVKLLFTSITDKESLGICERKLREDNTLNERMSMDMTTIVRLLRFCLTTTAFKF